jgi:hypothetical protein
LSFWSQIVIFWSPYLMAVLIRSSTTTQLLCVSNRARRSAQRTHRLMRSGRGFPMAFLSAPVMVKAAPTLRPRPSMPQFSSHRRSFSLYLPLRRFMPDRPAGMAV